MEQCDSRDNFDRYCFTADSNRGGSGTQTSGSQTNRSQLKSSPKNNRAAKVPKREADDDDWSD